MDEILKQEVMMDRPSEEILSFHEADTPAAADILPSKNSLLSNSLRFGKKLLIGLVLALASIITVALILGLGIPLIALMLIAEVVLFALPKALMKYLKKIYIEEDAWSVVDDRNTPRPQLPFAISPVLDLKSKTERVDIIIAPAAPAFDEDNPFAMPEGRSASGTPTSEFPMPGYYNGRG